MATKIKRIYNLADPILLFLSDSLLDSVDSENARFITRGWTPAKRLAFVSLQNSFIYLPSDNYMDGKKQNATARVYEAHAVVETKIRTIQNAVENVFGKKSDQFELFKFDKSLSLLSSEELYWLAFDVADGITDFLSELATEGITDTHRTEILAANSLLFNTIIARNKTIRNRSKAAYNKIKAGNALFTEVKKITNTGYDLMKDNGAKQKEYIIYDTPTGTPKPAKGVDVGFHVGNAENNSTLSFIPVVLNPGNNIKKSDKNGLGNFNSVEGDTCVLSVIVEGFQPYSITKVLSGENIFVDILLSPNPVV